MKRVLFAAFCIIALCSILLIANVETTKAGDMSYSFLEYWAVTPATIDGNWTSPTEWTDAPTLYLSDDAIFKYKMDASGSPYYMQFLIEFFTDNTTDTGDIWQILIDPANTGGELSSVHKRIDIVDSASYRVSTLEELYLFIKEIQVFIIKSKLRYFEIYLSAYNSQHQALFFNNGFKPTGYVPAFKYNRTENNFEDQVVFIYHEDDLDQGVNLIPETEEFLKTIKYFEKIQKK